MGIIISGAGDSKFVLAHPGKKFVTPTHCYADVKSKILCAVRWLPLPFCAAISYSKLDQQCCVLDSGPTNDNVVVYAKTDIPQEGNLESNADQQS